MVGQVDRRSLMGPSSFFSSSSSSSPDPDHGRPPKGRSCERDYVKQANSAPLLLAQNSTPDRLRYYFTAKPISHRILGVKLASSFLIFILESALSRHNGVWRKNVNAPRRPCGRCIMEISLSMVARCPPVLPAQGPACLTVTGPDNEKTKYAPDNKRRSVM